MTEHQASTPPAKAGRWIGEGLRSTLFLQPDYRGLQPSPGLLAGLCLGLLVLANLAALLPARRARRLPTATLLRAE